MTEKDRAGKAPIAKAGRFETEHLEAWGKGRKWGFPVLEKGTPSECRAIGAAVKGREMDGSRGRDRRGVCQVMLMVDSRPKQGKRSDNRFACVMGVDRRVVDQWGTKEELAAKDLKRTLYSSTTA